MKSFFTSGTPVLTTMINNASTPKRVLELIKKGIDSGTEAFGLQIEQLEGKYRTREVFCEIFNAMDGRPAYITNYRRCSLCPDLTDDELTEQMLLAVECGAALFDMRGDLFDPSPYEITYNEEAVQKQKELVKTVHSMGAEVLMSSHILEFLPSDKVFELCLTHAERGVDVSKIVSNASDDRQLDDTFKASIMLKEKAPVKTLFLCNGAKSRLHRMVGPMIGSCMYLNVCGDDTYCGTQPELSEVKELLKLCGFQK